MNPDLEQTHRTLKLLGFVGALAVIMVGAAAPGSATAPRVEGTRARAHAIALASRGGLGDADLSRAFNTMDPAMLALAQRFAPAPGGLERATFVPQEGLGQAAPRFAEDALQTLSWDAARLVNAGLPFSTAPNPGASPFVIRASAEDTLRALDCLSQAVYYEAAYESEAGQEAVAQVVLNRLRHPLYPKTVCGVVYQGSTLSTGCQFTFTCDGSLARAPAEEPWNRARRVAERALAGYVAKPVGQATHYHADYVFPYWAPRLSKVAQIGTHIFYRWSGTLGLPGAFSGRYAGAEPIVSLAAAEAALAEVPVAVAEERPIDPLVTETAAVEAPRQVALAGAEPKALASAPTLAVRAPVVAPPSMLANTCAGGSLSSCSPF